MKEIKIIGKRGDFDVEYVGFYDPLFKTVTIGPVTVPIREIGFYLNALYGAELVTIQGR